MCQKIKGSDADLQIHFDKTPIGFGSDIGLRLPKYEVSRRINGVP